MSGKTSTRQPVSSQHNDTLKKSVWKRKKMKKVVSRQPKRRNFGIKFIKDMTNKIEQGSYVKHLTGRCTFKRADVVLKTRRFFDQHGLIAKFNKLNGI